MGWTPQLNDLSYHLSDIFDDTNSIRTVIVKSEMKPGFIDYQGKSINAWTNILDYADNNNKVADIIKIALNQNPNDAFLISMLEGKYRSARPLVDNSSVSQTPPKSTSLEKLMGKQSTLLPISWLETGLLRSRSVARVERKDRVVGTGFLLANNLFLTNNHVLPDAQKAREAVIQFNYQQSMTGLDLAFISFELDPDTLFYTSPMEQDDWTIVKVKGEANRDWGYLELQPETIKDNDDHANIIQHPGGGPKQIALYHNIIEFADNKKVQYLTDTLPGSSGSPVFDSAWRLIALHHAGGYLTVPDTKQSVYRNEGISSVCIYEALHRNGIEL